jgi:hypothetical protein
MSLFYFLLVGKLGREMLMREGSEGFMEKETFEQRADLGISHGVLGRIGQGNGKSTVWNVHRLARRA